MKIIHHRIESAVRLEEDTQLHGTIAGNVAVAPNITLELYGTVVGKLELEPASKIVLSGTVHGDVVNRGGHLEVYGTVYGRIVRQEGVTIIDPNAVVVSKD